MISTQHLNYTNKYNYEQVTSGANFLRKQFLRILLAIKEFIVFLYVEMFLKLIHLGAIDYKIISGFNLCSTEAFAQPRKIIHLYFSQMSILKSIHIIESVLCHSQQNIFWLFKISEIIAGC